MSENTADFRFIVGPYCIMQLKTAACACEAGEGEAAIARVCPEGAGEDHARGAGQGQGGGDPAQELENYAPPCI